MDAPAEREWQNAENDDFDRRDARESDGARDDRRRPRDAYDDRYPGPPPSRSRDPPPSRPSPAPSHIIGVFGLSIRTTERDLEDEFARVGDVDKVVIVYDARTGRSRGFGFITMRDVETASRAIEQMNGVELHGRKIRVDYSSTSRAHDPTPGEYRGNPRPVDDRHQRYRGRGREGPERPASWRDRDSYRERDSWRDRGSWRERDAWRERDSWRDRDSWRSSRRYDEEPPRRWSSRRDDRRGPESDDWRRRSSPPRYRDYDDDASARRQRDSAQDERAHRYADEPPRRDE